MQIMSLFAKLTLDKSEYDKGIEEAEQKAESFDGPDEQKAEIEVEDYKKKVDEAVKKGEEIKDSETKATLDAEDYNKKVDEAVEKGKELTDIDTKATLDTEEFGEKVDEAGQKTESFKTIASELFGKVAESLVASGVTFLVTQFTQSVADAIDLAKNLGFEVKEGAESVGITTKAYQEWEHVLKGTGAKVSDFTKGVENINALMDGTATEETAEAFGELGINAEDAKNGLMTTEELLEKTVSALSNVKDEAKRKNLLEAIFGNGKLEEVLEKGSTEIKRLQHEANKRGLILSDEEIERSIEFNNSLERIEKSTDSLKETLTANLLHPLLGVTETLAKLAAFFNPTAADMSLSDIFADQDEGFADELVTIEGTAAAAQTLADKLLAMGDTSKMTAEQYAIWKGTAEELIRLVPTLGDQIDIESGKIKGNSEELKENIKQWENLAKQKALQNLKEEKWQAITEKNEGLIDASVKANKKAAEAEKARIDAYHAFSDEMEQRGLGKLDFEAGDLDEQIKKVMANLAELGDEGESDALALGAAMTKLGEAKTHAAQAQSEAQKLADELEKGKQEYLEWLETAEALYGITSEEAKDATSDAESVATAMGNIPTKKDIYIITHYLDDGNPDGGMFFHNGMTITQNAKGQWDVPYDNYPTLLHRNEMVLSASRARDYRENNDTGSVGVDLSSLPEMIIGAIRQGMENVSVKSFLNGREITDEVNRMMINELKARRYAT